MDLLALRGEFDYTRIIFYDEQGRAVKLKDPWWCNGYAASSEVWIDAEGKYYESHDDPEHGGWSGETPYERLKELDDHNPGSIPTLRLLGADGATVDEILAEKGAKAYHFFESTTPSLTGLQNLGVILVRTPENQRAKFLRSMHSQLLNGEIYDIRREAVELAIALDQKYGLEELAQELQTHPQMLGYPMPGAEGFARFLAGRVVGKLETEELGSQPHFDEQGFETHKKCSAVLLDGKRIGTFYRGNPVPPIESGPYRIPPPPILRMEYAGIIPGYNNGEPVFLSWNSDYCHLRLPKPGQYAKAPEPVEIIEMGNSQIRCYPITKTEDLDILLQEPEYVDFIIESGRTDEHPSIPFPDELCSNP